MAHIYVMDRDNGHMKIGFSTDPDRRLCEVTGAKSVLARWAHPQAFRVEQAAHRLLAEFREDGEWFAIDRYAAFSAVIEAMRAHDAQTPNQNLIDLTWEYDVPTPPDLPSDRHRLGYVCDNGIAAAGQQMKWMLGCGVSELDIYIEEATGSELAAAMKDCRQDDLFFAWSLGAFGKSVGDVTSLIGLRRADLVTAI